MLSTDAYIDCVKKGFENAVSQSKVISTTDNKFLSSLFIRTTHSTIEDLHERSLTKNRVCFTNQTRNNEFKRSEFLFDIHVCEKDTTTSAVRGIPLSYIKRSHVVIESEYAENLTESLIDFSKLACSNAPLKMMVLPNSQRGDELRNYLSPLTPVAKQVSGELYCIFLPHPRKWRTLTPTADDIKVYKFNGTTWDVA